TSQSESDFISNNLSAACSGNQYWIGAFQDHSAANYSEPAGGWKWVTGEPWSFTSWKAGEPSNFGGNEDYLLILGSCQWNDGRTDDFGQPGFVVEFEQGTTIPTSLAYVGNAANNTISAYVIDPATGALVTTTAPFADPACGATPVGSCPV